MRSESFDVVIVGGTPGGIMAAIAAARAGSTADILERTSHIGGLPANGLGATDIATRGATAGLFVEFVERIRAHYTAAYGPDSEQAGLCSGGYHFEASVAEKVLLAMLAEQSKVAVRLERQFDARPANLEVDGTKISALRVTERATGNAETYCGKVFVDATYEGDLAAAAGVPFRTCREGHAEFKEPLAGRIYKVWGGEVGPGSTGEGDDVIQAYNYRLCLTDDPARRVPIEMPARYDRAEFASLADDVKLNRITGSYQGELEFDGIGRVVNMVRLPNAKTDSNNQHQAFISTDLPEENYPWPTADWAWRDAFAQRLKEYSLGLLYFAQNDPALPEAFREKCRRWGLAKDEYTDNAHFPRQVYVREGRRIQGRYFFTAHDALPIQEGARPPVHSASITASHYPIDSHAVRKREDGRCHLDGFLSLSTKPYTVPYGVIVASQIDNLLIPVPVSGTHLGFSTLRMEPCWMALGQAAGAAAALAVQQGAHVPAVPIERIQRALLEQGAVLIYFKDAKPVDRGFKGLQWTALRGAEPAWQARLNDPITEGEAARFNAAAQTAAAFRAGETRGAFLERLYATLG